MTPARWERRRFDTEAIAARVLHALRQQGRAATLGEDRRTVELWADHSFDHDRAWREATQEA